MVGSDHETDEMRNHQADETDDPGEGDRNPGCKRHKNDEHALCPLNPESEVKRLAFPEKECVQVPGKKRQSDDGYNEQRRRWSQFGPGRPAQTAEHPEAQVTQLLVVADKHQEPDTRHCESIDGYTGKQQGGHIYTTITIRD